MGADRELPHDQGAVYPVWLKDGVEPFNYLIELLKHHEDVERELTKWMPWTYPVPTGSG